MDGTKGTTIMESQELINAPPKKTNILNYGLVSQEKKLIVCMTTSFMLLDFYIIYIYIYIRTLEKLPQHSILRFADSYCNNHVIRYTTKQRT